LTKLQKNLVTSKKLQGNNKQIQNKYKAKITKKKKKKNYRETKVKHGKANTNKQ
jgi:hypothetical protein